MALLQENQSNIPTQENKKSMPLGLLGAGSALILLMLVMLMLDSFHFISLNKLFSGKSQSTNVNQTTQPGSNPEKIIAKVGNENIYQIQLDKELRQYPVNNDVGKKTLLDKMIKDSIILQGGEADKLIDLDTSVFNSQNLDYLKRVQLVEQVKKAVEARKNTISGAFVSIYYYNNGEPAAIGYEKGREVAFSKISALHNAVVAKKMTVEQAGEAIKNDTSLAQLDRVYKTNAIATFTVGPDEQISFSKEFDALIRKLKPGETTAIYTGMDKEFETNKIIDVQYMFAQVTGIKNNGSNQDFDEWFAQKQKVYESKIY